MKSRLGNLKKRFNRYAKDDFHYRLTHTSINSNLAFFESYDGTSQTCHPLSIFEELINSPAHKNLKFVWSYRGKIPSGHIWEKYKNNRRIIWAEHSSQKYYRLLAKSKYIVSNSTFPHQFSKNTGQVYLNTWHGIPAKKMGNDIPLGVPNTRNVIRNFMAADYILSANPFMTNRIWKEAFKLDGVFRGQILEIGSPRVDHLVNGTDSIRVNRSQLGVRSGDQRAVVLFAPTWRGSSPSDITDTGLSIVEDYHKLRESLDSDKYIVMLKVHQLALRNIDPELLSSLSLVNNSLPTSIVLNATDHLVTDESSIFFDYLVTDKPISFYFSTQATSDERGLYFSRQDLPGHTYYKMADVASGISTPTETERYSSIRKTWRNKFLLHDDGYATRRVIEAVFEGSDKDSTGEIINVNSNQNKILIHVGSLIANGITTAAINFANKLCEEGYDVSIFYPYSRNENQLAKVYEFDQRIRHFPRVGTIAIPVSSRSAYRRYLSEGGRNAQNVNMSVIRKIFDREWTRCFGEADFDTVIAFDGYSVFWAELLLSSSAAQKFIWMHNDLMMDAKRTVNGHMPHYKNLSSLFTLYNSFDKVVSVSPDLTRINKNKMLEYAASDNFMTVQNFIDHDEVRRLASEFTEFSPSRTGMNFVTVGRLSPEKNQSRMIRAMKIVVGEFPDAQLYVIGDGPLRGKLEALIANLDLKRNVHMLGYHRNPHSLVAKCDYFAFSSLYEGQGLAVIEAMVLGKPIITTDYNVVRSVVGPDDGIITDASSGALAEGMLTVLRNDPNPPKFNPREHNAVALEEVRSLFDSHSTAH